MATQFKNFIKNKKEIETIDTKNNKIYEVASLILVKSASQVFLASPNNIEVFGL